MSFNKKNDVGRFSGVLLSLLISTLCLAAITLIASAISYCTADPLSLVKPLSVAAIIIGAAAAAFISAKRFGAGSAIISSLIFTLIMLTVGIISGGGKINVGALINYVCYMATATLFSYLAAREPKKRIRRKRH